MAERTFVVVGAGLAGGKAVETLRAEGFTGRVVLVGAEPHRPYERPPLSKDVLAGRADPDTTFVHEPGWYAEHEVELLAGTPATGLDLAARRLDLADGRPVGFDALLLATGAVPRPLPVPGADLAAVHYLRTREDAVTLRDTLTGGPRVVVVGAGWIGLEVAAAARGHGATVTVVEPAPTPLHGVLGPEMGVVFAALHRDHDVAVRTGTGVRALQGSAGRVTGVVTDRGEVLPVDVVVVGVGVRPADELARAAGLPVDNGVLVDAALRTDHPDVYAAGDVANAAHPLLGGRVRVEHWANALHGGPAAARSMLGQPVSYDRVPYFFSDQFDLGMEYSGWAPAGSYDEVVVRGDLGAREFVAFWLAQGRVLAGMNVNVWDVTAQVQALVRAGRPVDRTRLADPAVPLAELVPAAGS